jgi:hypothetical protein
MIIIHVMDDNITYWMEHPACAPHPPQLYVVAANIYRSDRRRGLTTRSSVGCIIAAIAIENRVQVWHKDRDFAAITVFTELAVV